MHLLSQHHPFLAAALVVGLATASPAGAASGPRASGHRDAGLSAAQRGRADALVSQFENSTTAIPYCHVEAIGDGRGYTVGRAGFTSANGDLLEVVARYTRLVPANQLAPLLGRLRELARHPSDSISGLEALPRAWDATCRDARQRRVQDAVVDELYYGPAVRVWRALGLRTPLSLAAFYDAMVQHGDGDDPDGVPALVRRATRRAGGTPRTGVGEGRYLLAFLRVRRDDLAHAHDPASRRGFASSISRISVWRYLVATRQWRLAAPLRVRTSDYSLTLR
ncbi:MAG: chitosanase [Thermoleophilaceae bacterium]